jgi:hypothetical protein
MPQNYGHLLKTQANDVLNAVRKSGLDPEDFAWELENPPILRHTPSRDYYFSFEPFVFGQHQAHYCPGDVSGVEYRGAVSWEAQLSLVDEWLTNLKREIQAPDLWSLLSEQTPLVQAASADSPNTPFSPAELKKISDGLGELQTYIEKTHQLDEQKQEFLESSLGYLADAAHRQGRRDWLYLAIGVLSTVVVGVAAAPDQAREIFRFVSDVLQAILKTPPFLP